MHSSIVTAAILDKASPLKPRDVALKRSSTELILLVACLKNAFFTSSFSIPIPLSVILIRDVPPSFISTVMALDLASMEFSIISLTIEEGLSITSPAAILSIVS